MLLPLLLLLRSLLLIATPPLHSSLAAGAAASHCAVVLPPPTALSTFAGTAYASAYHSTADDALINCRCCCRFSLADDAFIICCCCCRFRLSLHRRCHRHRHTLCLFVCRRRRRRCCSHHLPPPLSTPPLFHRLPLPLPLCFRNDEGNGRRIRNKSVHRVVTRPTAL